MACKFVAHPLCLSASSCADSGIDPQWGGGEGGGGGEEGGGEGGSSPLGGALFPAWLPPEPHWPDWPVCAEPPLCRPSPPPPPTLTAASVSEAYFPSSTKGCWLIDGDRCDSSSSSSSRVVAPFDGRRRWWTRTAAVCQRTDTLMFDGWDVEVALRAEGREPFSPWSGGDTPLPPPYMVVVFPPGSTACVRIWSPRKHFDPPGFWIILSPWSAFVKVLIKSWPVKSIWPIRWFFQWWSQMKASNFIWDTKAILPTLWLSLSIVSIRELLLVYFLT